MYFTKMKSSKNIFFSSSKPRSKYSSAVSGFVKSNLMLIFVSNLISLLIFFRFFHLRRNRNFKSFKILKLFVYFDLFSNKSGRRSFVRSTAFSCNHSSILGKLPESKISGTLCPLYSAGRV